MAMRPSHTSTPYWLMQAIGWLLFASFNFGTRIFIFPDVASRYLEISRFGFALLSTVPLRFFCRILWLEKPRMAPGVFSCLCITALLATTGEIISEYICHSIWDYPAAIELGFVVAESSHFFITLCCWCTLYFSATAYFDAEEQARQAVASLLAQRDAELEVLRFQIQPAFFRVGLDRISAVVESGDTRQASKMTSQFGGLLRSMLDEREVQLGDLASELVHLGDYLKIVLNREETPLEVDLNCDFEPNQILIPRWLLIPLAEATFNKPDVSGLLSIRCPDVNLTLQWRVYGDAVVSESNFGVVAARLDEIFGQRGSLTRTVKDQNLDISIEIPLVFAITT